MRRRNILVLILLLVVGFAAVSATLYINGTINFGANKNDFKIIFTNAKLNNVERKDFIDSETKQTITFTTNKLTSIDEEAVLDYEVTNTSRIYDADVKIVCNLVDEEENIIGSNDYISITYKPNSMTLEAGKTDTGSITAKLIKASTEDQSVGIKCTLEATAKERDKLGDEYVESSNKSRTLMALEYEAEDSAQVSSGKIWDNEISLYVTKVIFENEINPHETSNDLIFDISDINDGSVMAYVVENDDTTLEGEYAEGGHVGYTLYIQSDSNIKANENSDALFADFENLTEISGLEYFDTSNAKSMNYMFNYNLRLTSLDLSNFDTSKVTSMEGMFSSCEALTSLDVSSFNTTNVTNMSSMFIYCDNLTILDVSSFDTSNVTDMFRMFSNCRNLTTLDISNFDISKVTDNRWMFASYNTSNTTIYVKDATVQNWILTSDNDHPSEWTTDNVIIRPKEEA